MVIEKIYYMMNWSICHDASIYQFSWKSETKYFLSQKTPKFFWVHPKKKIFIYKSCRWWQTDEIKWLYFFYILINLKVIVKNLNKKITQPQITRIDLHHLFQHDPCTNQVQIPKFHSNRTSGSGDIAISFFLPDLVPNFDTRCLWTNSKSLLDLNGPKTRNIDCSNTKPSRIIECW